MSDNGWHYAVNSEIKGPIPYETIAKLIKLNVVKKNTLVWKEGLPDWLPAEQSELSKCFVVKPPSLPSRNHKIYNRSRLNLVIVTLFIVIAALIFMFVMYSVSNISVASNANNDSNGTVSSVTINTDKPQYIHKQSNHTDYADKRRNEISKQTKTTQDDTQNSQLSGDMTNKTRIAKNTNKTLYLASGSYVNCDELYVKNEKVYCSSNYYMHKLLPDQVDMAKTFGYE